MPAELLSLVLTFCDSASVHGILQARIPGSVAVPLPGDLPDSRIKAGSSALQVDSLPSTPPGKPHKMVY